MRRDIVGNAIAVGFWALFASACIWALLKDVRDSARREAQARFAAVRSETRAEQAATIGVEVDDLDAGLERLWAELNVRPPFDWEAQDGQ